MNKTFDFLLSGINSLVKLGKGGNSLKSEKDSHIEFLSSALELLPVRTKNPVDSKDSVNLEFLRENVLLNFGLPVQNLSELSSIPSLERRDKQIRYVEDIEAFYQFDGQSIAIAPNPDIPDLVILPDGIDPSFPGRWIKTKARIQFHSELIGNDLGDDHPQYQLRTEKDQPTGYVGKDSFGNINSNTDELAEGTTNLYYTDSRARTASVEDAINSGEIEKAPSQDAVFQALSEKEDSIANSDVNKFFNGLKEFALITIADIVDLASELTNILTELDNINTSVTDLDDNKEDNLPSGNVGEYLHSDKTFKKIDYSEIDNLPTIPLPISNTDELPEGTSNLYFTGERARSESVENTINELEEAKAPSQRAVSLALSGKEDEILPSDVDKFLNGLKEFVSITIGNVVGLAEEISDIYDSINSLSISLGNLISVPSQTSANEFLNGLNQFAEILISNVQGLDSALDNISLAIADKENNLPSGSAGQYLHSDKTFKQINYSEIGGTPPGGNTPTTITNINSTILPGYYSVTLSSMSPGRPIFFLPPSLGNIECILVVTKGVGDSIIQHIFPVKGDSLLTRDKVFMRKYLFDIGSGEYVWFDWVEILNLIPSLQFEIKSQARINVDSVPSIPSGNATLNCSEFSYYAKAGGNATITLSNMSILQTVVLEVASIGSAYSLTFSASVPITWDNQTQPNPTTTASRFDIYTFIHFGTRIHCVVALNQG